MNKQPNNALLFRLPVAERFVPLAAEFAGHSAAALGLARGSADKLTLAVEEVVAYLARVGLAGTVVEMVVAAGSHFVQIDIALPVGDLPLRAFNLTAEVDAADESGLDQLGLLIASRMSDRFRIARADDGRLVLTLIKERDYPAADATEPLERSGPLERFTIVAPDAARIKWFARLTQRHYPAASVPADFRYPGKVVDMAAAGAWQLLLADGPAGELGGGLAWRWEGDRTVELFGPYLFSPDADGRMAGELIEAAIGQVARTNALVLLSRTPTAQLPDGYLEPLCTGDDSRPAALFRLLHEDSGAVVWAHPELLPFLQREYRRLVFPREIRTATTDGEAEAPHSVLSTETDRRLGRALLRPIWPGADAARNLADHVALLAPEAPAGLHFEMDLGLAWQAAFTPALLAEGFRPRMLLPHAGLSDRVLFERKGAA